MTRPTATNPTAQPTIEALMVRFLATRSDAASAAVETGESEVEPHEVAAGFRVDPRAAWLDATAQITLGGNAPPSAVQLPTDWASLVAQPAAAFAVPMAAGHFPQRVKDLQPLLRPRSSTRRNCARAARKPPSPASPACGTGS